MSLQSLLLSFLPKLAGSDPSTIKLDSGTASSPSHPRPHDAAARGRRSASIFAPASGPNAILSADFPELINRSRAAYRNNGWIKQGTRRHVSHEVGSHIKPLFQVDDTEIKAGLNKQWKRFVKHADADGVLSFYGMLALAVMTRRTAAECFIRIRPRRVDRAPFPFQLQLLESEMVPFELFKALNNGGEIIHGIEFNRSGQRVAYHVYKRHPYDWIAQQSLSEVNDTVRIPARLMIHHYQPERPGQIRGRPDTVQSLVAAFDYQEYSESERVRKKIKAAYTAFLERGEYPEEEDYLYDPMTGEKQDDALEDTTTIEPGAYNILNPGEKIRFPDGDNTGQGYSDYQRWQLLSMAAGFAQPYQIFTGDLQGMNDRLWRAITNEYYRMMDMDQRHLVIDQICEPIKDFFIDQMWLHDRVDLPDFETRRSEYQDVQWQPQARQSIHRLQDAQAKKIEIDTGINSRTSAIAEGGRDAEAVDREIAEDKNRADGLGLKFGADKKQSIVADVNLDREDDSDEEGKD